MEKALAQEYKAIQAMVPQVFHPDDWYFAGGCIYSLWNDKQPKDYDLFSTSKAATEALLCYFEQNKHLCQIITGNAISMGKYQFILRDFGPPDEVVDRFDFLHNMFYFYRGILHARADWQQLDSNKLVFNTSRSRDVLNIITRIPKFVGRGMEITQAETLKILDKGTSPKSYRRERRSIVSRKKGKGGYR